MGRIATHVRIRDLLDEDFSLACDALVDTGAAHMVLPTAWRDRLGELKTVRKIECEIATQEIVPCEICGPVEITIEGFEPVYGEVMFLDMVPHDGEYEPLVGYLVLEAAQAAVDMLGHRPRYKRNVDLKRRFAIS